MKNQLFAIKLLVLFIVAFSFNTAFGQSRMIPNENGRWIGNPNFNKVLKGNETETTFYFDVKPGDVVLKIKITADVDIAGVNITFRDKDGDEITDFVLAQQTKDETEEIITKEFTAHKRMRIYMTIRENSYGSRKTYPGKLNIQFSGAFSNIFEK